MGLKHKNKGFTLVELIVVIIVLAIIAIIVIPNVVQVYNDAKINSFIDEAKTIYRNIETSYNSDFLDDAVKVQRYCESEKSYIRKLKLDKPDYLAYDIELSSDGSVTKFYVISNNYQFLLTGNNLLLSDIIIENVQTLDNFEYDCNGIYGVYCNIDNLPCIVVPVFNYNLNESNNL